MILMKESVLSLKQKTIQHWFCYFQIVRKYFQSLMTKLMGIEVPIHKR